MAEQEIEVVEETPREEGNTLLEGLRRILMAGIGAVALAQEEIEEFVNKLVERGEIADKDGRKLLSDIMESRKKSVRQGTRQAAEELDRRIEGVLSRLNLPTRSEIEKLSEQIEALNAKVDALKELDSSQ